MNKTRKVSGRLNAALCAGIAALIIFPETSRAWTPPGHEIAAVIAQDRLSADTLAKIRDIIGSDTALARIANCADAVKSGNITCGGAFRMNHRPSSAVWHFVDIPTAGAPAAAGLDEYCSFNGEKDNCVTARIAENVKTLSSPAAPRERKQEALAFIVHLMGDIHQPLHCAAEHENDGSGDRGGVLKPVLLELSSDSVRTNLHLLWDDMVKTYPTAEVLERGLEDKDTASWTAGDFISAAALESFKIAKETIYPSYHKENGRFIGRAYKTQMKPIVDERLQKAGVRLAYLLETTLGKQAAPVKI